MKRKKQATQKLSFYHPILTFMIVGTLFAFSNYYSPKWHFNWEGIRKEVKDSIIAFDKHGWIDYTDQDQIARHRWILKNVKLSEFNKLLNYPSGEVKAMSYVALMKQKEVEKYSLFKKSLNDTLTFVTVSAGCFIDCLLYTSPSPRDA